jgi:hypothetical protein
MLDRQGCFLKFTLINGASFTFNLGRRLTSKCGPRPIAGNSGGRSPGPLPRDRSITCGPLDLAGAK